MGQLCWEDAYNLLWAAHRRDVLLGKGATRLDSQGQCASLCMQALTWEARASPPEQEEEEAGAGDWWASAWAQGHSTWLVGCNWYAARYQPFRSLIANAGWAYRVNLGPQDSELCGYIEQKGNEVKFLMSWLAGDSWDGLLWMWDDIFPLFPWPSLLS